MSESASDSLCVRSTTALNLEAPSSLLYSGLWLGDPEGLPPFEVDWQPASNAIRTRPAVKAFATLLKSVLPVCEEERVARVTSAVNALWRVRVAPGHGGPS